MLFLTNLDLNQNELQNVRIQNLSAEPSNPVDGQIYYNTDDQILYLYRITKGDKSAAWVPVGSVKAGTGITVSADGQTVNLKVATNSVLGGVKIGSGLDVAADGTISISAKLPAGTTIDWNKVINKPEGLVVDTQYETRMNAAQNKIEKITQNGTEVAPVNKTVNIKVPTKVGDLTNDKKFVDAAGAAAAAPIQSVNKKTGAVTLNAADVGARPNSWTPSATDVGALPIDGGIMTGAINMNNNKITNVPKATADGDAINKKQLDDAIKDLGTVFDFKGSKPNKEALPADGNTIGDVWYVEDEQVGYIWIKDSGSTGRWEQLGPTVDLTGYLTKEGLLTTTGQETKNTMTQKAITEALNLKATKTELTQGLAKKVDTTTLTTELAKKADKSTTEAALAKKADTDTVNGQLAKKADKTTVEAIPVVKISEPKQITTAMTKVVVPFTGKFLSAFAKDGTGEIVLVDTTIGTSSVTFETAKAPKTTVSCYVISM